MLVRRRKPGTRRTASSTTRRSSWARGLADNLSGELGLRAGRTYEARPGHCCMALRAEPGAPDGQPLLLRLPRLLWVRDPGADQAPAFQALLSGVTGHARGALLSAAAGCCPAGRNFGAGGNAFRTPSWPTGRSS
jgi:hypothetical protein